MNKESIDKIKEINEKITELRIKRSNLKLRNEYLYDQMVSVKKIEEYKNNEIKNAIIKPASLYTIYTIATLTILNQYGIKVPNNIMIPMYLIPLSYSIFAPLKNKSKIDKEYNQKIEEANSFNKVYEDEMTENNGKIIDINYELEDLILKDEELNDVMVKKLVK